MDSLLNENPVVGLNLGFGKSWEEILLGLQSRGLPLLVKIWESRDAHPGRTEIKPDKLSTREEKLKPGIAGDWKTDTILVGNRVNLVRVETGNRDNPDGMNPGELGLKAW
ncbi:hypothetical protein L6452_19496 [Arctium lappa]|uniref:Uncharacterized protein n=1 Tax=Arctium lappa TaxID=4217 RepID=A0ACB9B995_ARCLA|nr:hypothetical protein L6452_19496 [Arctium lappa]